MGGKKPRGVSDNTLTARSGSVERPGTLLRSISSPVESCARQQTHTQSVVNTMAVSLLAASSASSQKLIWNVSSRWRSNGSAEEKLYWIFLSIYFCSGSYMENEATDYHSAFLEIRRREMTIKVFFWGRFLWIFMDSAVYLIRKAFFLSVCGFLNRLTFMGPTLAGLQLYVQSVPF